MKKNRQMAGARTLRLQEQELVAVRGGALNSYLNDKAVVKGDKEIDAYSGS